MFPVVNIANLIKCSSLNIHEMWDLIFIVANKIKGDNMVALNRYINIAVILI
jgi:glycine betaine/choline ABC-type transport system substrate-binding protein